MVFDLQYQVEFRKQGGMKATVSRQGDSMRMNKLATITKSITDVHRYKRCSFMLQTQG